MLLKDDIGKIFMKFKNAQKYAGLILSINHELFWLLLNNKRTFGSAKLGGKIKKYKE